MVDGWLTGADGGSGGRARSWQGRALPWWWGQRQQGGRRVLGSMSLELCGHGSGHGAPARPYQARGRGGGRRWRVVLEHACLIESLHLFYFISKYKT